MVFPRLRSRLAALLLLFASPGLAGLAVDAAHPCPEQAPWTVQDGGHHHDQPLPEHHDCKCVGACQTAAAASVESADSFLAVAPVRTLEPGRFHLSFLPLGRPTDRLPPATAPPLV